MRAFRANDSDAAAVQALQQARDIRLFTRQRTEVKHDRTTGEERRRAIDLQVQRVKPILHRRFGRENERHKRTAADSDERTQIGCGHALGVSSARCDGQPEPPQITLQEERTGDIS